MLKDIAVQVAITDSGEGWAFGLGVFGQLGLGDNADRLLPEKIEDYETNGICSPSAPNLETQILKSLE